MAAKNESRFFIVKTVNGAKEKIDDQIKAYNKKYVKKTVENSREFIKEMKADPVERIDGLIDDGKKALGKVKSDGFKAIRKKMTTSKNDVRKKFKKINLETQRVYKGIENDAKMIVEDLFSFGKKNLDKIPMKMTIEKKISAGINVIPEKLNLPSKSEIDNLLKGIDGVTKKVDVLNKQFTNA